MNRELHLIDILEIGKIHEICFSEGRGSLSLFACPSCYAQEVHGSLDV